MRKCYLLLVSFILISKISSAQCQGIIDAMVNACGGTEGTNEFVIFKTAFADSVGAYTVNYGSDNPPSTSPTGVMPGVNASPKTVNNAAITSGSGCTIHELTSSSMMIPANSTVMFIPYDFDTTYDISEICTRAGGSIYVAYINIDAATSKWSKSGTIANQPTGFRYLQVQNSDVPACDDSVRRYDYGWPNDDDGNFLTWTSDTDVIYTNTGCTNIVTPVRLLSFGGQLAGQNANLYWQTASEQNTKSFEIDWSSDGVNFTAIATAPAAGNSSVIKSYSKIDYSIASGVNFYRLKMIDMDGRVSYSPVIRINNPKKGGGIKVYADEAGSHLNMEWESSASGTTTAVVYDFVGRALIQTNIAATAGVNRQQIAINALPKAGYVLKLVSNGQAIVTRFVKQ
jgi:hypothetical protein